MDRRGARTQCGTAKHRQLPRKYAKQRRFKLVCVDSVDALQVIDLTEMTDDMLSGWSMTERTRWEGEGGLIRRIFPWLE